MRNVLLETFILVMKHFLMMSQDFLSHYYYYIYASSFMTARNINPTLFDLSGRKVLVLQKGHIYIMGNKKVVW